MREESSRPPDAVDLLLPTVNRTVELVAFLESLERQTFTNVRVIIVDQNPDDRLEPLLGQAGGRLRIVHLRSEQAVSRAYNTGLPHCQAEVIGFPADDLGYPPDLLQRVVDRLAEHPELDGVSGRTCDEVGRSTLLRWDADAGMITRGTIFRRSIGATMFLRRRVIEAVGEFDETLGQRPLPGGGTGGSSEESDYLLRALAAGFTFVYDPTLCVVHPSYSVQAADRNAMVKAEGYGVDHSRMLKKHGYPVWYVVWRGVLLFAGALSFLLRGQVGNARFYAAMGRGRLKGLRASA